MVGCIEILLRLANSYGIIAFHRKSHYLGYQIFRRDLSILSAIKPPAHPTGSTTVLVVSLPPELLA